MKVVVVEKYKVMGAKKSMKIMFLCNLVPGKVGAFELMIAALGTQCRDDGDELCVLLAGDPIADVADRWRAAGVRWKTIPRWIKAEGSPRPWAMVLPAFRHIRKERPVVVGVHFGNELSLAVLILMLRLVASQAPKWVWHQHQQIAEPRTWMQKHGSRIRILSWVCHGLVSLYKGGQRSLLARNIMPSKVVVIPNGTPEPQIRKPKGWLRAFLGIPADAIVVTNVSSLIYRKRIDVTLKTFAKAAKRVTACCQLVLVGTGEQERVLRQLAGDVKTKGMDVYFLGKRQDVSEILKETDIFIMTSSAEACPYALIEAMSVRCPCVTTPAGAASEIVEHEVSGYVVEDEDDLVKSLVNLIEQPCLRRSMGDAGYDRWENFFRQEHQIEMVMAYYKRLAKV